ncbi:unnamed protein product [Dibothriocephalus latus]|uniref:Ig-like domain-containing protein n=1 Tax=Dibothriocephalus latus TaxID=60516 RepID=A0A3P6QZ59_DIBLA|nr:unnamed protein product [Dibothriocephalus latus]
MILQGPTSLDAQEASPATFVAQVVGAPEPEICWLFNHTDVIKPSSCVQMQQFPDGRAVLSITKVRPEDSGEYTVRATNPFGTVESTAELKVLTPLPEETIQCPEGTSLSLIVEATGVPPPKLNWFRNGAPFVSSPDMQITEITPTQHRLEVNELFLTDSSEILVEAVNPFGRAVTKATLVVTPDERKKLEPPVFVQSPPPQFTAPETSTVR